MRIMTIIIAVSILAIITLLFIYARSNALGIIFIAFVVVLTGYFIYRIADANVN